MIESMLMNKDEIVWEQEKHRRCGSRTFWTWSKPGLIPITMAEPVDVLV